MQPSDFTRVAFFVSAPATKRYTLGTLFRCKIRLPTRSTAAAKRSYLTRPYTFIVKSEVEWRASSRIAVMLDDPQLAYHLGQVLMKSGAVVYSKNQAERYMGRGLVR